MRMFTLGFEVALPLLNAEYQYGLWTYVIKPCSPDMRKALNTAHFTGNF
jgi:hypothetical protein